MIARNGRGAALLAGVALVAALPMLASLTSLKPHDLTIDMASLVIASAVLASALFLVLRR